MLKASTTQKALSGSLTGRLGFWRSDVSSPSLVWDSWFLPRNATQSAVMPQYVVRPSVCPSVRNVQVPWSHRLEYFENNFTAD